MFNKITITLLLSATALVLGHQYYQYNSANPWTRDGQVRAHIVQVTPQVTGQIVKVLVNNEQRVEQGQLLFIIDQSQYLAELKTAKANQMQAEAMLNKASNEQRRAHGLAKRSAGSISTLSLNNYDSAVETAAANLAAAKAQVTQAQIQMDHTKVYAPVSGFITNLNYHLGSNVVANSPVVALIDEDSFWVEGFFKETELRGVRQGQQAKVMLMGDRDTVLQGRVESVGYGIAKADGSTGNALLPNVNPNFQWIRLAQRLPVKVILDQVPEPLQLRVGVTASVQLLEHQGD
ncbi:HlyD family secretion protein [Shewanella sp. Scap07]|uniref:efflux RND transporter periplasmic adaptor subunit n=1 Tax=Shewanella sp. Scap07 TaxID=2589987 RepID=UPI0015C06C15|nr:HlyD family secretion protein [Shewanella sp. Scap07]QLE83715.1 HlyD family secretion protein [Shewanella sp. Scap07]